MDTLIWTKEGEIMTDERLNEIENFAIEAKDSIVLELVDEIRRLREEIRSLTTDGTHVLPPDYFDKEE